MNIRQIKKSIVDTKNKNLDYINIVDKDLTTLASWIEQLASFTKINFGNNQLRTLPESIGQLTNLERLEVRDNLLTNLPNSVG